MRGNKSEEILSSSSESEDDQEINFDNYQSNIEEKDKKTCFIIRKPFHEAYLF